MERARPHRATLGTLLAVLVAACSGSVTGAGTAPPSSPPAPVRTALPLMTPSPPGALTPVPVVTPSPTGTPPPPPEPVPTLPPGPPTATLLVAGRSVAGDLGSFSWSAGGTDFGSDAPWLPGEDAGTVPATARVAVRFEPALRVAEWKLLAAPAGGQGEPVTVLASGSGGPVEAALRLGEGAWEVQLSVELGSPGDARGTGRPTYYWRVTIAG